MSADRIEKTFRCPRDGRAMARLVVTPDGMRVLDIVGGRHEHLASQRADLAGAIKEWRQDRDATVQGMGLETYERVLQRAITSRDSDDGAIPAARRPVPSGMDEMNHRAGYEPIPETVTCPRCHRRARLAAIRSDQGWSVVLIS